MDTERLIVDLDEAQALFDALPAEMQWPTLSPAYVAADASRDPQLKPIFLVSREGGGLLMHAVQEAPILRGGGCDWQSAYGYGGPIVYQMDAEMLTRAWSKLDEVANARQVVAEFVRLHPGLDNHRFYNGFVCEDRAVVGIDLTVDDLFSSYRDSSRRQIRKAERTGLRIRLESQDYSLNHFPSFYRRCMQEIGADNFYLFSDSYFERLLLLPTARVLSISNSEECLSMALFLFGSKQAEYHLSGTLRVGRQSGATNLLMHTAAQMAQSSGCCSLYLGGGTGASPGDPLLRFKETFSPARSVFRIGYKIYDPVSYERLRKAEPELAANSKRILFYRG
jgi:hypothetical protein